MGKPTKQKDLVVDVVLTPEILKENENLQDFYSKKDKKLTYKLSPEISDDVLESLQKFLSNPKIGTEEIVAFNPLVSAINQMQELKDFQYEPELSDELEAEVKEKCLLEHLSYDLDKKEYIYDFKVEIIQKSSEKDLEKLREKTDKEIEKALDKQHKASHQVYKDSKKLIGSFNSSISSTKKEMKEPHLEYNRLVDTFYNALKQLSDNTKLALDNNFDECLKKEEEIKEAKKKAQQAEANAKIEELSEENQRQAELLQNQQKETLILQTYNKIKYTNIGSKSSEIATNALKYDLEALKEEKIKVEKYVFDDFSDPKDSEILTEDKEIELRQEFEQNKVQWLKIIDREIKLREEKAEAEKTKTVLETVQKQSPSFMDDDTEPFATVEQPKEQSIQGLTEEEKFDLVIEHLCSLQSMGHLVVDLITKIDFNDEFYQKKTDIILNKSLKQINDWNDKLVDWTKENQFKYVEWLKQQNNG